MCWREPVGGLGFCKGLYLGGLNPSVGYLIHSMTFDYIIAGAGSAGCVVANRLSEDPSCNVLLLEAGGKNQFHTSIPGAYAILHRSPIDWAFWTEPQAEV